MEKKSILLLLCFFVFLVFSSYIQVIAVPSDPPGSDSIDSKENPEDSVQSTVATAYRFVDDPAIFREKWDKLNQPAFWREIIRMSPDTCILNLSETRQVLDRVDREVWRQTGAKDQAEYLEDLRERYGLDKNAQIFATSGKRDFYEIEKVMPEISEAIDIFVFEGTNPWYAQAIILIECPGKLKKSYAGAYGAFQLMKSVGRENGLVINGKVDERKNLKKSAAAAAKFIRKTCIPSAYRVLNRKNIPYNDTDLWFRLLVLHIYHAGAGNVNAAMNTLPNNQGGMKMIQSLWHTSSSGFGNASQNYSQIALASLLEMQSILKAEYQLEKREEATPYLGRFLLRKYTAKEEIAEINMN